MSNTGPPGAGGSYSGQSSVGASSGGPPASSTNNTSTQNLNQIVTDYLKKKGFTRTEAVFRRETEHLGPDGKPSWPEGVGPKRYAKAFNLLHDWVENNLDIYKFELRKVLWPLFVYSYLELVEQGQRDEAKRFLDGSKVHFEAIHGDTLRELATISLPLHISQSNTARTYKENKYKLPLNATVSSSLFHFIDREIEAGGDTISYILSTFCQINASERGPIEPYSFEAILRRGQHADGDDGDLEEGIPGVFTGVLNRDVIESSHPLKLGPLPMEPDLRDDVRAELEDEDRRNPPKDGRTTLVDEFDRKIKREESQDAPCRDNLPLPPSRARDVVMEMQKVRENRDRFKIEGRTGGVGVPVSACMFTFHNTLGSVSCMDFSNDHELVAVGTMDSYIRVWTLDGRPLPSKMPSDKEIKINNRKLVGHSGPVYGVSFSDSIHNLDRNIIEDENGRKPDTNTKLLLSCSGDGQIRLWSLDYWTCMCIFKAHDGPVFRVLWSPHGHYFASAGWDKTVRVFVQDHASAQRIMVGHDTSISALAWHPNGTYLLSASDEMDKSIRMWSVTTGSCVRVFTGHTDYISALECAHNGTILASADTGGNIFLWDIEKGTRIKRCRGHGKGGIPSLSFSAESNVLVSGGLDGSVRVWDVELPTDPSKVNPLVPVIPSLISTADGSAAPGDSNTVVGTAGVTSSSVVGGPGALAGGANLAAGSAAGVTATTSTGSKKKSKEVQITPDQISAFLTKKTPVMKVQFTRMNLVVAGGCYDPER